MIIQFHDGSFRTDPHSLTPSTRVVVMAGSPKSSAEIDKMVEAAKSVHVVLPGGLRVAPGDATLYE